MVRYVKKEQSRIIFISRNTELSPAVSASQQFRCVSPLRWLLKLSLCSLMSSGTARIQAMPRQGAYYQFNTFPIFLSSALFKPYINKNSLIVKTAVFFSSQEGKILTWVTWSLPSPKQNVLCIDPPVSFPSQQSSCTSEISSVVSPTLREKWTQIPSMNQCIKLILSSFWNN